jgi:hypothetical protein
VGNNTRHSQYLLHVTATQDEKSQELALLSVPNIKISVQFEIYSHKIHLAENVQSEAGSHMTSSPLQALPKFLEFTVTLSLFNILFGQYTGGICSSRSTALYQQLGILPQTLSSFLHRFHYELPKTVNKQNQLKLYNSKFNCSRIILQW